MEEKLKFEYSLFRDGKPDHIEEIDDIDFVINTLVNLSIFRPQKYELIFEIHRKYSEREGFREKFLERALKQNSNFINLLIEKRIYSSDDVLVQHEVDGFSNTISEFIFSEIKSGEICSGILDLSFDMVQTDYRPGTIEWHLKYDDINEIRNIYQDPSFYQGKANIIEIGNIMNLEFDLLGFCGFFGSVHCFKFFLETKMFTIDQSVIECVTCGGSIEIFQLCLQTIDISELLSKLQFLASFNNNIDILNFLYENGADLTQKDEQLKTCLHYAAQNGHLCAVEYLVHQKADINSKTEDFVF